MSAAPVVPPWATPEAELLYEGELSAEPEWKASERIYTQGARHVDLYLELRAPERAAATLIPPRFEWYLELNPTEGAGWYAETREELEPDGQLSHRHRVRRLGDLEAAATDPGGELAFRVHVRQGVNARSARVVFRGWVGQGGHAKITAIGGT
jgi:hypothetical protein